MGENWRERRFSRPALYSSAHIRDAQRLSAHGCRDPARGLWFRPRAVGVSEGAAQKRKAQPELVPEGQGFEGLPRDAGEGVVMAGRQRVLPHGVVDADALHPEAFEDDLQTGDAKPLLASALLDDRGCLIAVVEAVCKAAHELAELRS